MTTSERLRTDTTQHEATDARSRCDRQSDDTGQCRLDAQGKVERRATPGIQITKRTTRAGGVRGVTKGRSRRAEANELRTQARMWEFDEKGREGV